MHLSLTQSPDFIKLGLYTAFFFVLLTFYGLPIHIIRDWFMTTKSFLKRLHALVRYRQALRHMDQYPDATAEELGREDTCIICREEMRPWDPSDTTQVERSRAKKLPCGHILHFGCLKSWLERQQVCPTCRRSVAREAPQQAANGGAVVFRLGLNFPAGQDQQPQPPANGQVPAGGQPAPGGLADGQGNNQNRGVRMFNLGPIRLGFAQGGVDEIREMAQRLRVPGDAANPPPPAPTPPAPAPQENTNNLTANLDQIRSQLLTLGQQVRQEMANVQNAAQEVHLLNLLTNELARLRQQQQQQPRGQQQATPQNATPGTAYGGQVPLVYQQQPMVYPFMYLPPQGQPVAPAQMYASHPLASRTQPMVTRHVGTGYGTAIPAGSPELPEGVVIPPGWSLLPLQRVDGGIPPADVVAHNSQAPAMGSQDVLQSFMQQAHQNPRSRGTSPAPAPGSSGQAGRAAGATGNVSEPSRVPGTQTSSSSDAAAARQQGTSPPVTAPIPVAPNWGGPAQLFSERGPGAIFGYQLEPTPGPQDEAGESSTDAATAATAVNGVSEERSNSEERAEAEVNGSSNSSRAGPRPVTVEEADDEDDER